MSSLELRDINRPLVLFPLALLIAAIILGAGLTAFRIVLFFIFILEFPGYAIVSVLLPKWDEMEKCILGAFVGFGVSTWFFQFFSFLGVPIITPIPIIIYSLLSLFAFLYIETPMFKEKADQIIGKLRK